jgi:hypothetical protein
VLCVCVFSEGLREELDVGASKSSQRARSVNGTPTRCGFSICPRCELYVGRMLKNA